MKKFEILRELPRCDRDAKRANAAEERAPTDLLKAGSHEPYINVPITLNYYPVAGLALIKKNKNAVSAKRNKVRCALLKKYLRNEQMNESAYMMTDKVAGLFTQVIGPLPSPPSLPTSPSPLLSPWPPCEYPPLWLLQEQELGRGRS